MHRSLLITLPLVSAFFAGCAAPGGLPPSGIEPAPQATAPLAAAPAPDCARLQSDMALATRARDAARDGQDHAWKAVVPVVVVMRYAQAGAEAAAAGDHLRELAAEAGRQGCGGTTE